MIQKCDGTKTGIELKPPDDFLKFCLDNSILLLTEKPSPVNITNNQSPLPSLRYLEIQLTGKCNLKCRHCYIEDPDRGEVDFNLFIKTLVEFDKMQGLVLMLSGGEPLLYSHFRELNDRLPDFSFRKVLLTNGLIVEDFTDDLNVQEIQFSLDGLKKSHEHLRGKDTFDKTISAMKNAGKSGYSISVSTMIHPANVGEFKEIEKLISDLGVSEWGIDVPIVAGRLKKNSDDIADWSKAVHLLGYAFGGGYHGSGEGFACGHHLLTVFPNGDAAKCGFYKNESYGNIAEGLREIWSRSNHMKLSELGNCIDCKQLEECRGGCRYRAAQFDNPLGVDPVMCSLYGNQSTTNQ